MNLDTFTPELVVKIGRLVDNSHARVSIRILAQPMTIDETTYDDYEDQTEEYVLSKREERRLEYLATEEQDEVEITMQPEEIENNDYRIVVVE